MATELPVELDFVKDDEASSERMNRAMLFLYLLARAAASVKPDYERAIREIQAIGLERLNEVLSPIFFETQALATEMQSTRDYWVQGNILTDLRSELLGALSDAVDPVASDLEALTTAVAALQASAGSDVARLTRLEHDRWFINHG